MGSGDRNIVSTVTHHAHTVVTNEKDRQIIIDNNVAYSNTSDSRLKNSSSITNVVNRNYNDPSLHYAPSSSTTTTSVVLPNVQQQSSSQNLMTSNNLSTEINPASYNVVPINNVGNNHYQLPSNHPTMLPSSMMRHTIPTSPLSTAANQTFHTQVVPTISNQLLQQQQQVQQILSPGTGTHHVHPFGLPVATNTVGTVNTALVAAATNILNAQQLQQQQQQQLQQQQLQQASSILVSQTPNSNPHLSVSVPTTVLNVMPGTTTGIPTIPTSTVTSIPRPITLPNPQQGLTVQDHPSKNPVYNGVNPKYPNLEVLNQNPPIFTVNNFLSATECDFLINVAQDCFTPAPVVGKGAGEVSPSRTSSTCYLAREDLPRYLNKVSLLTGKPIEHCELPQVGRYFPSQQYLQHFDAFDLSNEDGLRFASNGGQRVVTLLVYLNDVERGGHTHFPHLNLSVKPKRGMALVFFPSTVDGLLDKNVLHAAKPAVDTKYVSQVWIRQGRYDGMPSKRMFSSVDQAMIVQKSLIAAREGQDAMNDDIGLLSASLRQ